MNCIQVLTTPIPTQCIQVVQAQPTIVPPQTIDVLINGVQQATYYSPGVLTVVIFGSVVISVIVTLVVLLVIVED